MVQFSHEYRTSVADPSDHLPAFHVRWPRGGAEVWTPVRARAGAAQEEAPGTDVAGRPGQVADPLEAEHRVVDVERDHRGVARRVRRGGGDPAGHGPRLVDALLE